MALRNWSRLVLPCRLRKCRSQLALVVKAYWHSPHSYGRSPLCVRMWRISAPLSPELFSHMLHRYGAPVKCTRLWPVIHRQLVSYPFVSYPSVWPLTPTPLLSNSVAEPHYSLLKSWLGYATEVAPGSVAEPRGPGICTVHCRRHFNELQQNGNELLLLFFFKFRL